jgi:hypothetical protein
MLTMGLKWALQQRSLQTHHTKEINTILGALQFKNTWLKIWGLRSKVLQVLSARTFVINKAPKATFNLILFINPRT